MSPSIPNQVLSSSSEGTIKLQYALEAFKTALNDDQKTELDASNATPDAADVMRFTAALDRKNAERRSRCVATRVHTILESVQRFSAIVETFVSSNPIIAALIWGSVKFALLIASDYSSYFEKLSRLFMQFGRHCPRYSEYQSLYLHSKGLQASLCGFYATLIHCCTKAVQVIQRSGWTHIVKIVVSSFEADFSPFDQELYYWSKEVNEEIWIASQKAAHEGRSLQANERKEAKTYRLHSMLFRKDVEKDICDRKARDQALQKCKSLERRQKLLDKLSDFDHVRPFKRARKQCIGGTAQWLSKSKELQDWATDTTSSVLWCYGKLGSGKTVLMANTIAELAQSYKNITYFFCQFDNEKSLKANTVIRSLTRQILETKTLTTEMEFRLERLSRYGEPDIEDLVDVLEESTNETDVQFIVIDALDECTDVEQKALLKALKSILSQPNRQWKLLLSSRDGMDGRIKKICDTVHSINTNSPKPDSDLEAIVEGRLNEALDSEDLILGDPIIIQEIRDALVKGADGMLLWVEFQLQEILRQTSDHEIRVVLQNLPKGLHSTYERLLGRVIDSGKDAKVKDIFFWVAYAKRPLSLEELREAIAIEPCQAHSEPDRYINNITQVPGWCFGLATCDEEDGTLQFSHSTVRSFLLDHSGKPLQGGYLFELENNDLRLGKICVTYLNFSDFETQLVKKPKVPHQILPQDLMKQSIKNNSSSSTLAWAISAITKGCQPKSTRTNMDFPWLARKDDGPAWEQSYALLNYASEFWIFHCINLGKEDQEIWSLWKKLLSTEKEFVKTPWARGDFAEGGITVAKFLQDHEHPALWQLLEDGYFRLNEVAAKKLIWHYAECGPVENFYKLFEFHQLPLSELEIRTILELAIKGSHIELVDTLLTAYVDFNLTNTQNRDLESPLRVAAEFGYAHIVGKIVAAKGNANAASLQPTVEHGNSTRWASMEPAGAALGILANELKERNDALQAAAKHGHHAVTEILIAAGAAVNAPPAQVFGRTALQAAAENGHLDIVEKLLAAKADINQAAGDEEGRTALQAAATGGHLAIVNRLLELRADVNQAGGACNGRTALQAAAESGHVEVVRRLLASGADINQAASHDNGLTALQAAAKSGNAEMVRILLAAGADVNAAPGETRGCTALQAAVWGENIAVVTTLLAAGADVNGTPSKYGHTALEAAISSRDTEIIKVLKESGAEN